VAWRAVDACSPGVYEGQLSLVPPRNRRLAVGKVVWQLVVVVQEGKLADE